MDPIKPPIGRRMTGPKVSNLQKALLFLIVQQDNVSDFDRNMLEQQLAADVRMNRYGDGTAHIVGMWQYLLKQRTDFPKSLAERVSELPIGRNGEGTGDVDDITAEALNWLLKKLRALSR